MSEPAPATRRRWLAWGAFAFFLFKGLAWLAVPALIAAGLWSG